MKHTEILVRIVRSWISMGMLIAAAGRSLVSKAAELLRGKTERAHGWPALPAAEAGIPLCDKAFSRDPYSALVSVRRSEVLRETYRSGTFFGGSVQTERQM